LSLNSVLKVKSEHMSLKFQCSVNFKFLVQWTVGLLFGELIFSAVMKYAMQSSVQLRKLLLSTWLAWSNHYFKYECNFLLAVLKVEEAKSVSKVTCTCQWRWL